MKTLIMLSAIPASGKSTWARHYLSSHPNTYIVSSDETRKEVTGVYDDHSRQAEVWKRFSEKIHEYGKIKDATVILDALNDLNSLREKYVKDNPEFDRYVLVVFPHKFEDSVKFNSRRSPDKKVPDDILLELSKKFEEPSEEVKNLFDEIREIRYSESFWKMLKENE